MIVGRASSNFIKMLRLAKNPTMARMYFAWVTSPGRDLRLNGHRFCGFATFSDYWSCYLNRPTQGEMAIVRNALAAGGVAIDVGANVGVYAASMADVSSTVLVHALEPVARTYSFLQRNTCHLPNVRCHRTAIAASPGWVRMTSSDVGIATNRIMKGSHKGAMEMVPSQSIDAFCDQNAISTVVLLKVDVEGAEVDVFRGMRKIAPEIIILEICPENLRAMGAGVTALYDEIRSHGYSPHFIRHDGSAGVQLDLKGLRELTLANILLCRNR